jgi:hypothetical protein
MGAFVGRLSIFKIAQLVRFDLFIQKIFAIYRKHLEEKRLG